MIEAVMLWNELNNYKSHWAIELDPEWHSFAEMVTLAADTVAAENSRLQRVLAQSRPLPLASSV